MKNANKIFVLGLALCFGLSSLAVAAKMDKMEKTTITTTTTTTEAAQTPPMDEAMMAKWKEYATPNENHRVLDQVVGNWDYTSKMWMSPAAPPEESTGTSQAQWVMDGRFVQQNVHGQSMGQPFDGTMVLGYDNAKKSYVGTWYDNMGTGMMNSTGQFDPTTKTLTQNGEFDCPFKGHMNFRWVTRFVDDNTQIFEGYGPDESGKEYKHMEIIYKRK